MNALKTYFQDRNILKNLSKMMISWNTFYVQFWSVFSSNSKNSLLHFWQCSKRFWSYLLNALTLHWFKNWLINFVKWTEVKKLKQQVQADQFQLLFQVSSKWISLKLQMKSNALQTSWAFSNIWLMLIIIIVLKITQWIRSLLSSSTSPTYQNSSLQN